MSHENSATETLRSVALKQVGSLASGVQQAQAAQASLRDAADIVETIGAAALAVLACETLAKIAKEADAAIRVATAEAMQLGATTVHTPGDTHVISLKAGVRSAIVTDPEAIPADLWTRPEPKPDLTEIGKRLRSGAIIPGATLSNGAAPSIQIKRRDRK